MRESYTVKIVCGKHERSETWKWFGQYSDANQKNKVLKNLETYSSDTELHLNEDLKIIGGYSYVYNQSNQITVTKDKEPMSEAQKKAEARRAIKRKKDYKVVKSVRMTGSAMFEKFEQLKLPHESNAACIIRVMSLIGEGLPPEDRCNKGHSVEVLVRPLGSGGNVYYAAIYRFDDGEWMIDGEVTNHKIKEWWIKPTYGSGVQVPKND